MYYLYIEIKKNEYEKLISGDLEHCKSILFKLRSPCFISSQDLGKTFHTENLLEIPGIIFNGMILEHSADTVYYLYVGTSAGVYKLIYSADYEDCQELSLGMEAASFILSKNYEEEITKDNLPEISSEIIFVKDFIDPEEKENNAKFYYCYANLNGNNYSYLFCGNWYKCLNVFLKLKVDSFISSDYLGYSASRKKSFFKIKMKKSALNKKDDSKICYLYIRISESRFYPLCCRNKEDAEFIQDNIKKVLPSFISEKFRGEHIQVSKAEKLKTIEIK